ncbi:unnamed protein product [Brachionus calyciflorus]|uniref:Tudor domain-containing protein n=1 Tax=Brachionus calyciflorus TaxID=104777 RepID=A0A814B290_9BILA|nr:unnamed protein product [Brachionus calyciflorus]
MSTPNEDDKVEASSNSNRKCGEMIFIKSPNNFWIHFEETKNDYTEMLAQLQLEYQDVHENSEIAISDLKFGSIYCSFNHILLEWHRCEIIAFNKTNVYISYIDIGQTDLVTLKSIKSLRSHFQTQPPFAIHCTLSGIKPYDTSTWPLEVVNEFTKVTHSKILTLNIKSKTENLYHMDLFVKNINVSEHLVKLNYAVIKPEIISADSNSMIHKIKVDKDKEYSVTLSSIVNPFCFYVQIKEYLENFGRFEMEMQEYYQNVSIKGQQLVKPQIGQLCMAKYTDDQHWYRAKVKEKNYETNTFRAHLIDYGNEQIVSQADLLQIEPKFMQHPIMAIKCCLDGIRPSNKGFSEVADFMCNSVRQSVMCIFTGRKINDFHLVSVDIQGVSVSKILLENSYATKIENCLEHEIHSQSY